MNDLRKDINAVFARQQGQLVVADIQEFEIVQAAKRPGQRAQLIVSEVERGAKLPGLYPMNAETKARYEAWKKKF